MLLSKNFYRLMFFFGALWNFSFAIPGLLFPEFSIKLTFGTEMDQSLLLGNYYAHSMYLFWWGAVLVYGIGYYLVSCDISKNRLRKIIHTYEFLVSHDIKCDFHIFEVNEKEKRYSNGINYNKWLPYKEVLKRMHRSRCVLEILQKPGEGPTIRSTEAIVYNKKIITNDAGAAANIHTNILCFCAGKI
ncbi:MAG: hypothetical protein WA124_00360 [Smithella sp.]